MNPDTILDTAAVAEHLRCSLEQAETLMRQEELPATKIGRGWITTYSELIEFVSRRIKTERRRAEPIRASVRSNMKRGARPLPQLPEVIR